MLALTIAVMGHAGLEQKDLDLSNPFTEEKGTILES